ncbi:hypothetical protein TcYC6_0072680 [Trypanosoma cruzi]|uniref:EF-hand domain-containing protein n=1 Tax=Trypanosoma cruzi TaxID=5693 RepID=A0A7J6YDJ3_TRYCR|nr:hypothetical protein ECC02_002764 [Trypanosoma cruzi]KAF8299009.1 hypothetical protein TcYC6_0072680 [Trypanosoma cruzi]
MVVTSERQASAVLGVPPYVAARAFKDVTRIKEFGAINFVSCCILETAHDPSTVGVVRRVTLDLPGIPQSILRERLASVEEDPYRTCIRMDYVPCDAKEAHRSAFGVEGTKRLLNASTFATFTAVSKNPNRCFLEISTKFTVDIDVSPDGVQRAADNPTYHDIDQFWNLYVTRAATALEDYLLSTAFATTECQIGGGFEKEFVNAENEYCQWAAKNCDKISREEAMQVLEKALNAWQRERCELKHQQLVNAQLMADAAGSAAVAASAHRLSLAAMSEMSFSDHSAPKPSRRTTATSIARNTSAEVITAPKNWVPEVPVVDNAVDLNMLKPVHVPFFSPGGGRVLSVGPAESEALQKVQTESRNASSPHRPAAKAFQKELLLSFLTEIGTINERVAQTIFNSLDTNHEGFVTEHGVSMVLSQMDPLGLYEDRNGKMLQMEECRQAVGTGIFRNISIDQSSCDTHPAAAASAAGSAAAAMDAAPHNIASKGETKDHEAEGKDGFAEELSPLQALIRRQNEQKKVLQDELIKKRTAELMNNYAYRTRGRLHYDEFCLMMLHLLKDY